MSILFGPTLQLLERGMGVALARQGVTSANVANLDTPGYVPRDVDFQAALEAARAEPSSLPRRTHAQHLGPAFSGDGSLRDVPVEESPDLPPGLDGNAVDLDTQMTRMAQSALTYQASARATSRKLALLRYVASEGMG